MTKILFICHGNICRSTMAQFVLEYLAAGRGLGAEIEVDSAGTSTEELGNPPHPGTRRRLAQAGIPCGVHYARQVELADYRRCDYLIGMDSANVRNTVRLLGGDPQGKICRLLDFTASPRDIADPWYTGDFDATYRDIRAGCEALLDTLTAR